MVALILFSKERVEVLKPGSLGIAWPVVNSLVLGNVKPDIETFWNLWEGSLQLSYSSRLWAINHIYFWMLRMDVNNRPYLNDLLVICNEQNIRLLGERYLCSKLGESHALKVQFVKGMVSTMPGTAKSSKRRKLSGRVCTTPRKFTAFHPKVYWAQIVFQSALTSPIKVLVLFNEFTLQPWEMSLKMPSALHLSKNQRTRPWNSFSN